MAMSTSLSCRNPNLSLHKTCPSSFCPSRVSFKFGKFPPSESAIKPFSISCTIARDYTLQMEKEDNSSMLQRPDAFGRFGKFGGKYVPETLMCALTELESAFKSLADDEDFQRELDGILRDYVGRESPLYFAERLTEHYKHPNGKGPEIYLKREDLNHTGAHKINNAVAQALLAKRLGKKRIIAETGAGQHGVATATVCARFGLQCIIYMGAQDMERQSLNVFRMRLLGAEVRAVNSGTATLKDATSEAIRDWVTNVESTHYILGSVAGPHPYPMMVREFHAVIGKETRKQAMEKWGGKPDVLVACVGGGSNAMGLFHEFVDDSDVRLIGVEAAGFGLDSGKHAATLTKGEIGVLHGAMSYLLQDDDGQIIEPHSISAGLDYPGVGPEHSFLKAGPEDRLKQSLMARWREPNLTLHRYKVSGPDGSLVSSHASAHISVRLVPGQELQAVIESLTTFLQNEFGQLESQNRLSIEINNKAEPWLGDPANDIFRTLEEVIIESWEEKFAPSGNNSAEASEDDSEKKAPGEEDAVKAKKGKSGKSSKPRKPLFIREGGSIPAIRFLEKEFGAPAAHLPCGLSSDSAHLDNERMSLINLLKAREIFAKVFARL